MIKLFFFLFFMLPLFGCSQKYQTYHIIDKNNFNTENPEAPITRKLRKTQKVSREVCRSQFFFSSNAVTESKRAIEQTAKSMCPKSQYLVDSKLTETWWTTIAYSRSCMRLEGYCSKNR